jgi:putative addiction module component (TIGR02574 family)
MAIDLASMSVQERLELIETIWDSLPEQLEAQDIPDWHMAELAKRRADASASPAIGKPWRDVLDPLEAKS